MPGQKTLKDLDLAPAGKALGDVELATCRFLDHLVSISLNDDSGGRSRKDTFARMDLCQRMYDGDHWRGSKLPKHRARSVTNKCYSVVEGALPIITDNRPKAEIIPGAEGDEAVVEQLRHVYDAKCEELMTQMKTELATKSQLIIGEGYHKVFWNPLKMGGLGDVDVVLVDPRRMSFIGGSDPLLTDAYAVIYRGRHSLGELQAWYPKMAERIHEEWVKRGGDAGGSDGEPGEEAGQHRAVTDDGTGAVMRYERFGGAGSDGLDDMEFVEAWIDDKTLFEYAADYLVTFVNDVPEILGIATDENKALATQQGYTYEVISGKNLSELGFENQVKWIRKYPFGRIIAKAGDLLLCDKPSIYEHGRCPYVRFFGCPVPGKNYFLSEIDQVISLQLELNKRKSQIIDIMNLTSNPPMIVNIMSGIKPSKMTNQPGLIIPVSMDVDRAAKWLQVPNIPSHLFISIQDTTNDIADVTGYHDITAGRKPTGITSGVAIEGLQEAAQTRYRQKARYLEYSLKLEAELMLSIIWQFYKEPRIIRSKDKDDPSKYKFETVNFADAELVGGLPDVRIESGSTMPVNEAVRRQQAMELFQIIAGTMGPGAALAFLPELMHKWNYPNVEGIMKLIREGMQAQAQQPPQVQ